MRPIQNKVSTDEYYNEGYEFGKVIGIFISENWVTLLILLTVFVSLLSYFIVFRKKKEQSKT
jgi:hypothetical protein